MTQMSGAVWGGTFTCSVTRYPNGRYGLVGAVPVSLTEAYGGAFPGRRSLTWATEQEAIDALNATQEG